MFGLEQARGNGHLWAYVEPLEGVFEISEKYLSSYSVFKAHVLKAYGFSEKDLRFQPFLKNRLKKLYEQKASMFRVLRSETAMKLHHQNLDYEWIASVTIRMAYILDVFELDEESFYSEPISSLDKQRREAALKSMLNQRVLSPQHFKDKLDSYQYKMQRNEWKYGQYSLILSAYPRHKIMPFVGELSEADIGNAILLGIHYVGLQFGQYEAHHGIFYTTDDFLRHDLSHLIDFYVATEGNEDTLDQWPNIERLRRWLRHYIESEQPSVAEVRELQVFVFFRVRELLNTIPHYLRYYSTGEIEQMGLENYRPIYESELPNGNFDRHIEAVKKFFSFVRQS